MRQTQNLFLAFVLAALGLVGIGIYRTGLTGAGPTRQTVPVAGEIAAPVDQASLLTAQALVRLPTTAEERALAEDALRFADREMDLSFADAVRAVAMHPRAVTPELVAMERRAREAQAEFAADDTQVAALVATAQKASGPQRATLDDQLNLVKARLELVRDELDDASQDLVRAGGDPQGRMDAMMEEHEASSRSSDTTRINTTAVPAPHGLVGREQGWRALAAKQQALNVARRSADSAASSFARQHQVLEAEDSGTQHREATTAMSHAASEAMLLATQRKALDIKTRGTLDQHLDNQRHLADVYARWSEVVGAQRRAELNGLLRIVAMLLAILVAMLLLDRLLEHRLDAMSLDQRRTQTLYMALRVTLQIIGVVVILLVIFGVPDNLGTFLGLAGAGLTVALKDFIVGFIGWFVLMGRDGIGIGDLVEINGVTGEVVELGMFQTVLLETGNWTDAGHLTGRRVTFTNSFAIEGHYFNFSTSGQWLWDEVRIVVPAGHDPYPIVDALRKQVEEATAESASRAALEFKGSRRAPRLNALTAAPALNIKPIMGGIEITVRYLTHVRERAEIRAKLYSEAVNWLGAAHVPDAAAPNAVVAPPATPGATPAPRLTR